MKHNTIQSYLSETIKSGNLKTAVSYKRENYTYSDLNEAAGKIAKQLELDGIGKGDFIGVFLDNKYHVIASIIGILKLGGIFVPLDKEYPLSRLEDMVSLADIKYLLIDDTSICTELCKVYPSIVRTKVSNILENIEETDVTEVEYSPDDSVYIYFTSGTTGKPKAILGSNKGLTQFIDWEINEFKVDETFKVSQLTPVCHDPYLRDIFVPLFAGATISIPDNKEVVFSENRLTKWIDQEMITLIHCTPSLFSVINNNEITSGNYCNLKYILLAGEKVLPNMLKSWYEIYGEEIQLVNLYGPTETTLAKFFYYIKKKDLIRNSIPIGQPIKGVMSILLDKNRKICKKGIIGEIYIRTPYRTKGYYKDDELMAEKFIKNPFGNKEADVLFKTGDLARVLDDGNYEFIGRIDRQIKILGNRVELSDVENCLLRLDRIKDSVVIYKVERKKGKLIGFLVVKSEEKKLIDFENIKEMLRDVLPEYMIPSSFVILEDIPKTNNNKIDYKRLVEYKIETNVKEEIPLTLTEKKLCNIWSQILEVEFINTDISFFSAGGNSIDAMKLVGIILQEFEVELPLGVIFEEGTIKAIGNYIDKNRVDIHKNIEIVPKRKKYPVTPAQKRMYFMNNIIGKSVIYNLPNVIKVEGVFDKNVFSNALKELIKRHEGFRTKFIMDEDEIYQVVEDDSFIEIPYTVVKENEIDNMIEEFIQPFYLDQGKLIRVKIAKVEDDKHYLFFDMHHIIADGTSLSIFTKELLQLCNGSTLNPAKIQYKDYQAWHELKLEENEMFGVKNYWLEKFAGDIQATNLPLDYQRPVVKTYKGDRLSFKLDQKLINESKCLVKKHETTLYTLFYSAYLILLHKYTGQEELIVGTPVQGRNHIDLQEVIGMFVNTVVLKSKVDKHKRIDELIKETSYEIIRSFENQQYPLEELITELDLPRDTSRNPLFDTVFSYHNYEFPSIEMGGISFQEYPIKSIYAKFDIEFTVVEKQEEIQILIDYCSDLFDKETIKQMIKSYILILEQCVNNTSAVVENIQLLTEYDKVFSKKGYEKIEYPKETCVHEIFEDIVKQYPNKTALKFHNKEMSYSELNRCANQLARKIRTYGIRPDDLVPIISKPSFDMIIAIIAVIKSGAAYVPINPDFPRERINYIIDEVEPKVVLKASKGLVREINFPTIYLDDDIYVGEYNNLDNVNCLNNLLYIIFTSGTTGKPKGVMIEHLNIVSLLMNDETKFDFNSKDTWLLFHTFCFDVSVWEIFGSMLYGGKLIILPGEKTKDTYAVKKLILKEKVTILNQVPSSFYNFMKVKDDEILPIRYLIFAGEKLTASKLLNWYKKHSHVKIINMYGITETTIHVTYKEVLIEDMMTEKSIVGKALPNNKVYIMNGNSLCGLGMPGEICVAGLGVARGYINNKLLTEDKFVENPIVPGERIYRSGDLAKWMCNGEIEYLGRIDHQVQVRGFRIELGEIEFVLRNYKVISDVVVQYKEDDEGYLVVYFVAAEKIDSLELRTFLLNKLPEYMVPQYLIQIPEIPVTSNGKTDKKQLPNPKDYITKHVEVELPTNEIEQIILDSWSTVLGIDVRAINESFFLLGGDSIKAFQVVAELKKHNLSVEVSMIFQHQTVKELANYVTVYTNKAQQGIVRGVLPLTPIQSWFFNRESKDKHYWNQAVLLETIKSIDEDNFETALQCVLLHHDVLRCVFRQEGDKIIAYNRGVEGTLCEFMIYDIKDEKDEKSFISSCSDSIQKSFDLKNGPLVKAVLFRGNGKDKILLVIHHLVIDSVSWQIVIEDIIQAYLLCEAEKEVILNDKTDSFLSWSKSLPEFFDKDDIDKDSTFWQSLSQLETTSVIGKELSNEENIMKNVTTLSMQLTEKQTDELMNKSNVSYNTNSLDLLLAALGIALKRWKQGGEGFLINLEGHGREQIIENIDISRTVGWFTSFYPILLEINDIEDLGNYIKVTKESLRNVPNKGISYGLFNEIVESPYYKKLNIQPEISFSYFGKVNDIQLDSAFNLVDLSYGKMISEDAKPAFPIDIICVIESNILQININYNKYQFEAKEMENLMDEITASLHQIIRHCVEKDDIEYSPDDFGISDLSFEELDNVLDLSNLVD